MVARRGSARRPATGRSFLIIVIVASVAALAVALWTLHSLSQGERSRGNPANFRL